MDKLTKAQEVVLRLIFDEKLSEEEALERSKINIRIYEKWFKQPFWTEVFDGRMQRCRRRSEIIIATFKEVAASKLILLTDCEKETTARLACLDILGMEKKPEEKVEAENGRVMKPETQDAILKIMAGEKENQQE